MNSAVGRKYLTLQDASTVTGLSVGSLRRAIADNRLKRYQPSGIRVVLVAAEDLEAFIRGNNQPKGEGEANGTQST